MLANLRGLLTLKHQVMLVEADNTGLLHMFTADDFFEVSRLLVLASMMSRHASMRISRPLLSL